MFYVKKEHYLQIDKATVHYCLNRMASESLILLVHKHEKSIEITKVFWPVSSTSPEVYGFLIDNFPRRTGNPFVCCIGTGA